MTSMSIDLHVYCITTSGMRLQRLVMCCLCVWLAEKDHNRYLYHCCRGSSHTYNCSVTWLKLRLVIVMAVAVW